jgi:hypothetical protein
MITKEQAQTVRYFKEIGSKSKLWRSNGKCKVWKTRPNEFKLPIKHGLYSFGYITESNCHSFEIVKM